MSWTELSDKERDDLLKRKLNGEYIGDLANELELNVVTLDRYMRAWKNQRTVGVNNKNKEVDERQELENPELFQILKRGPISVKDLSRKLDRSEDTILSLLDSMEKAGYLLDRSETHVSTISQYSNPTRKPKIELPIDGNIGDEVSFGVASDIHSGSTHCQPTNLNYFIKTAYHEYDIRHIFIPGDVLAGIYGYKGQEHDLIPEAKPVDRRLAYQATEGQIWLANTYIPSYPGLIYYLLGGNHDWWHVTNAGIDPVWRLCNQRDDMVYLGYDIADIPLTKKVAIRLVHPSGGLPYALSYRMQKFVEQTAFEELSKLIDDGLPPKIRFLISGHLHVEVKFQSGPITASQAGCFEGRTNYLARKGLFPVIGGQIWRAWLSKEGQVRRVEYTFEPYAEIENDWMSWPTPPEAHAIRDADKVDIMFSLRET